MPQNKIFKDLVLRRDPVKEYVQLKAGREGLVEARFDLSIHEYRVFFWLLTMIDSSDQELAMHRISIKDIIHTYKLSNTGYHYEHLRQAVLDLKNREFSWQAIIDGKEHILTVPLIDKRAEPRFDEDKTHIWVRLHPDLKPYLLDLKTEYLNINMRYLVNLASPYSIKLYMILKHRLRQNTPFPKYDVGDLRFMLSVPVGTYPKYAEFKNQILIRCMNEINQYTDIRIDDISEIRKGRIVHTVCFTLNAKRSLKAQEKPELLGLTNSLETIPEENEDELFKPLRQHKITKSTFEGWINQFGRDQVRVNSQYALKQISYGNIINTGGYLRRIISDVEIYHQNIEAKENKKQELNIKQFSNSKVETPVSDFERLMKEKEALMIEYNAKINEATYLLLNDLENADCFLEYVEFQKSIPNGNPFMKIALTAFDKLKVTRETLADVLLNSSGFEEALKREWLNTYFPDVKDRIIQKYKSEAERLGATLY